MPCADNYLVRGDILIDEKMLRQDRNLLKPRIFRVKHNLTPFYPWRLTFLHKRGAVIHRGKTWDSLLKTLISYETNIIRAMVTHD